MNDILHLKGSLQGRPNPSTPGARNLPKYASPVTAAKLEEFIKKLKALRRFWDEQNIIDGCLIDVCYIDVIAKSNRISALLLEKGSPNISVVGARFVDNSTKKHVITHHVSNIVLDNTIAKIHTCARILSEEFGDSISAEQLFNLGEQNVDFDKFDISKTTFRNVIVDAHYVESFEVPNNITNTTDRSIVTVYKTKLKLVDLMARVGISVLPDKILSDTTLLLYPDQIKLLTKKAPFLVAMATEDLSKFSLDKTVDDPKLKTSITIGPPSNEPIIGVIDTLFDASVYFSKWVEYIPMIPDDIPTVSDDFRHGTQISSIIVDGPSFNPNLDDGCGRFRVRHFGVTTSAHYSSFVIMKKIEQIVASNLDIKVWNLSLGSDKEINQNSISPEADVLDRIQYEYDVIFVVAGTNNRNPGSRIDKMIGAPADSINSIVVNAVDDAGKPASYSRRGLVLSFFNKPDVCTFGGDKDRHIRVCNALGESYCSGTSYAAPWVTRKVAYLIEVLGFSREVAKALIVDAAAGWNGISKNDELAPVVGHGVVPQRIEDVVKTPDDEIKFILGGVSEKWETYTYNLPVPVVNEKYPFVARATLCYFPSCSINQGVDYTNTELDVYFGRVQDKGGIKTINRNKQSNDDGEQHYVREIEARENYRKWDNTKHISEEFTARTRARNAYASQMWGLSIKAKERLRNTREAGIKFGLVVTLKEIAGVNRINDFIRNCELRGWLVSRIDMGNRIEIFNKAQEIVAFE